MKKQFVLGIAAGVALTACSMTNAGTVYAATQSTRDVPVTYDNRNIVPDPDNPTTAQWGVAVPTHIYFTDDAKTQAADVELVGMNGHTISELTDSFIANVKVKSANGMTLKIGAEDATEYTLTYGAASVIGTTDINIADLKKASALKTGTATLTGTAVQLGNHTDTLTYTIENTVQ